MRIVKPIAITDSTLISSSIAENDYPVYNSTTSYTEGQRVIDTTLHKIYESLRGGSSTVTISWASPTVIGWVSHGLPAGAMVTFTSTNGLPGGITAGTVYYVVNPSTDTFNIAATLDGSAIATTSSGSGTFTATESANLNHTPSTSPTYWLDCGSTNKWAMFDQSVQSQSSVTTGSISFKVFCATAIDTIPLLNITGANTVRIKVEHGADGTVYDKSFNMVTDDGAVVDGFSYFFTGFVIRNNLVVEGIPPYSNSNITITLTGVSGAQLALGCAIFGMAKDISSAQKGVEQGARLGIDDYSIKTVDAFGNYTILERAFANRANYTVYVNRAQIDATYKLLTDLRATPAVYIGSRELECTIIYGFYRSWELEIAYYDFSIFTMEINGLT